MRLRVFETAVMPTRFHRACLAAASFALAGCGAGSTIGNAPAPPGASGPAGGATTAPGGGATSSPSPRLSLSPPPTASATPIGTATATATATAPVSPSPTAVASASPAVPHQVLVSGSSPFAGTACGTASGTPAFDSVAEPQIATDPTNGRNVVLVWQQDRFNADGGAVSNVVGVSHDGGNTFHEVLVRDLSLCTGGTDQRVSDPWLSWGPDGTLYLASLTFSEMPQNMAIAGPTALVVSRSNDAGESWSAPVPVQPLDQIYNDRESVTADPTRPGHAYYVFVLRYGSQGESGLEEFSSSANDGATWSAPTTIYAPPPGMLTDPTLLAVLPDGTLLNLVILANLTPFLPAGAPRVNWQIVSQRSSDAGKTWSAAVTIASIYPAAPVDPQTGKVVRAYPVISEAVGRDGSAYVAWNVIPAASGPSTIEIARSRNGGKTWTLPMLVKRSTGQAFLPSVAVGADGTVAVTYDDTRNDTGTGTADNFTTDIWSSTSHDAGTTWTERHLAGPFNMASAPESDSAGVKGLFVGDYQGLTAVPGGFGAVFAQGQPQAIHGPTDLFFARFSGS